MGNIVTVSRAPRLKFVCPNYAGFYVNTIDMKIWCNTDRGMVCLDNTSFSLPYDIELGENEVIPFESFEAMCKWVAGGRKLEDLQGDAKDEWVAFEDIPIGTVFTRINSFDTSFIKTWDDKAVELPTGDDHSFPDGTKVWPLGPGDSITIESEKP